MDTHRAGVRQGGVAFTFSTTALVEVALGEQFEAVLTAAQRGAPWALDRLWRDLSPLVAGYLRLQGATEPDDLTSEAFLGVFRRLEGFSGDERQLRSWVLTIAHRRLIDERRRSARRPVDSPYDEQRDNRTGGDVEQEAVGRLGTVWVREVLDRLPRDQRDTLLLRILADLTVEQVAQVLGKRPGAVKALQRRGLASLRRTLAEQAVPL